MALNDLKYDFYHDANNVGVGNRKHGQKNTFTFVLLMIILVYCDVTMPIYVGLASTRTSERGFVAMYSAAWSICIILQIVVFLLTGITAIRELVNKHIVILWAILLLAMSLNAAVFIRCLKILSS